MGYGSGESVGWTIGRNRAQENIAVAESRRQG